MVKKGLKQFWATFLVFTLFPPLLGQKTKGAFAGDFNDLSVPQDFKPDIRGEYLTNKESVQYRVQIGEVSEGEVFFLYTTADHRPLMKALYRLDGTSLKSLRINHLARQFSLTARLEGQDWKIIRAGREFRIRVSRGKPLVTHGNFYLFLLESQDKLERGEAVIYDFFAPEDHRLVELKLTRERAHSNSLWSLKMETTSAVLRLFLKPFFLDFDYAKRIIISGELLEPIYSRDRMKVRYFSTRSG